MFIRTKDGVYEVVKFDEECIIPSPLIKVKNNYGEEKITHCCKGDIINQSENLAELCDEGVIEVKFSSTGYIAHFNKNIDELRKFLKYLEECQPITKDEILNVYGAIWTSKGLIYVAKMNDKGELCLL